MDETRGEATAPDQPDAGEAAAHGRRLAVSTLIFALATGLSRVLGLVREIVTGTIRTKTCRTAGSRQSSTSCSLPSRPRSQGIGSSTWMSVPIRIETA